MTILPQHRDKLASSAIAEDVIAERGYRSAERKVELRDLGFGDSQRRVPALVIPVHPVLGDSFARNPPGRPTDQCEGKAGQVRSRRARSAWRSTRIRASEASSATRLSALHYRGDSQGGFGREPWALLYRQSSACGIGAGLTKKGGRVALADWERVALNDRKVYIAFDSDVMQRQRSRPGAATDWAAFIERNRADVHFYLSTLARRRREVRT